MGKLAQMVSYRILKKMVTMAKKVSTILKYALSLFETLCNYVKYLKTTFIHLKYDL